MEQGVSVVKQHGGNAALAIESLLLLQHGVEAADGVLLKAVHGAALIEDESELCGILLHGEPPVFQIQEHHREMRRLRGRLESDIFQFLDKPMPSEEFAVSNRKPAIFCPPFAVPERNSRLLSRLRTNALYAFRKRFGLDGKFVIMYSGNIGLYYDLEGLFRVIESFQNVKTPDGRDVVFTFVGEGSMLEKLKDYQQTHQMENVVFIPYQDKDRLVYSLNAADVHWCVNAKGIKGVSCPSKFYGIAAAGKPVLAVLEKETEVRMLIEEIGCGKCVEPGEYKKIRETILWFVYHADDKEVLEMGEKAYAAATVYKPSVIMKKWEVFYESVVK